MENKDTNIRLTIESYELYKDSLISHIAELKRMNRALMTKKLSEEVLEAEEEQEKEVEAEDTVDKEFDGAF